MTAIIENIIPAQNFEIVQNKIGVILLLELLNQKKLQCIDNEIEVFLSRQTPYDKSEDVMINVSMAQINYSGKTQIDSQGLTTYNVDIYCNSDEKQCTTGSENTRIVLNQITGLVRYILSSTKYKTLGFQAGFIGGTMVDSIQFLDNFGNQEANFVSMSRIVFTARLNENQLAWEGIALLGNDTNIKLDSTNKGYKLTFNN
jgi:hypothetical protein